MDKLGILGASQGRRGSPSSSATYAARRFASVPSQETVSVRSTAGSRPKTWMLHELHQRAGGLNTRRGSSRVP